MGGGVQSPAGEGVGVSPFQLLEKRLSTLSTLCIELSSELKENLRYEPTVDFNNTFRGKAVYLMKKSRLLKHSSKPSKAVLSYHVLRYIVPKHCVHF